MMGRNDLVLSELGIADMRSMLCWRRVELGLGRGFMYWYFVNVGERRGRGGA